MSLIRPINKTVDTGLGIITNYFGSKIDLCGSQAEKAVKELSARACIEGQMLKFLSLPEKQLERLDELYLLAAKFKQNTKAKFLTVLGIGGSKHPVMHMLSVNGYNIDKSIKFYSDIDTVSKNRFVKEIGGDVRNSNYLVVSKSGKTFEVKDALSQVESDLIKAYVDDGYSEDAAKTAAAKHFVAVTDKEKGDLGPHAIKNKWLGKLLIHDDVGGRFSAFDDHTLFTLAYAGMPRSDMMRMLSAANKMTEQSLNPNLSKNDALSQAFHWVLGREAKHDNSVHHYVGSAFRDTIDFHTQMEYESVKVPYKQISLSPEAMHHSAEMHFNTDVLKYTSAITSPMDEGVAKAVVNKYINALNKSYSDIGPHFNELVEMGNLGLTPEAAGALTQSRALSTVFQEIIKDIRDGSKVVKDRLSSVFQDNVEKYKENLRD